MFRYSCSITDIIAVGSQFLTDNLRKECFAHMPLERQRIIDLITTNNIQGVLFVSGDIHAAELSRLNREGTYPIYELTTSALTSGSNSGIAEQSNSYRVPRTAYGRHNFGLITITGEQGARILTMRIMDKNGKVVWEKENAR